MTMKLIQSFIAIPEVVAKQQEQQKKFAPLVEVNQPTPSQESNAVQVVLFQKPSSAMRSLASDEVTCVRAV